MRSTSCQLADDGRRDPSPELAAARRRLAELEDTESQYRKLVEQLRVAVYRDLPTSPATSEYISPQVEAILRLPARRVDGSRVLRGRSPPR
jgi:hypothetical protein